MFFLITSDRFGLFQVIYINWSAVSSPHMATLKVLVILKKVKLDSGFLPSPKNMHVGLIGDFKLTPRVSVGGCLSPLSLCDP